MSDPGANKLNAPGDLCSIDWLVITDAEQLASFKAEWDALYAANDHHTPFQSWGWTSAWLRHLAGPHRLRIVVGKRDGRLQFVLPLIIRERQHPLEPLTAHLACSYGSDCSDHVGCLYRPECEDELATLVASAIGEVAGECEQVRLSSFSGPTELAEALRRKIGGSADDVRVSRPAACPTAVLPDSWDEFLQSLSSNFRSQVRRSVRRVANDEGLKMRRVEADESQQFAEVLIGLNRKRIAQKGGVSSLEQDSFRDFLRESIPYLLENRLAWADVIEDKDGIAAAALNLVQADTISFYMGGFDDRCAGVRPGTALFAAAIQRGIEQSARYYDFLRGSEPYKYRWGASDRFDLQIDVINRRTARVRLKQASLTLKESLRGVLRHGRNTG